MLFNVTIPKKFGSAMKILVKIKVYLSIYLYADAGSQKGVSAISKKTLKALS